MLRHGLSRSSDKTRELVLCPPVGRCRKMPGLNAAANGTHPTTQRQDIFVAYGISTAVRRAFVRDTLVQVIGTTVGGLLVVACLKFGGLLGEVQWGEIGKAVGLGLLLAFVLLRMGLRFAEEALVMHSRFSQLRKRFQQVRKPE